MSHTCNDFAAPTTPPPPAPPTEPCPWPEEDPALWEDPEPPLHPAPRGVEPFGPQHLTGPGAPAPRGLTAEVSVTARGITLRLTAGAEGYSEADAYDGKQIPRVSYRIDGAEDEDGEEATAEQIDALLVLGEELWAEIDEAVRDRDCAAAEARYERALDGGRW